MSTLAVQPRAAASSLTRPPSEPSRPAGRVLFITRDPPETGRGQGGANVYARDVLLFLARSGYEVGVLLLWPVLWRHEWVRVPAHVSGTPLRMVCPGYRRVGGAYWHPRGALRKVARRLFAPRTARSETRAEPKLGRPLSAPERAWVAAAAQQPWDIVICNYCWLADAFAAFGPATRKVILTHDVWHQHVLRASADPHLRALDRARERAWLEQADTVVAITARDRDEFRAMAPDRRVVACPISCTPRGKHSEPVPGRLLFVGSNYAANVAGLRWFLDEVAPLLARHHPGRFTLHVIGRVGESLPAGPPAIDVVNHGPVPDLDAAYAEAEIVIVPLLAGSGLKIKLVEALAHACAVVTTPAGAQGLESLADDAFRVADGGAAFADTLAALSQAPSSRRSLEDRALAAARQVFSPAACYTPLLNALRGEPDSSAPAGAGGAS